MAIAFQFTQTVQLDEQPCVNCGTPMYVPVDMLASLRATKRSFYCINGHSQSYTESTEERMKREHAAALVQKDREAATLRAQNAELAIEKNNADARSVRAERKLKRVTKGACPCCNRSFANMRRHMETKHPDFDGTPAAPASK